jgi:hypothetical protein
MHCSPVRTPQVDGPRLLMIVRILQPLAAYFAREIAPLPVPAV